MTMPTNKPFKGTFDHWSVHTNSKGEFLSGHFVDHPVFGWKTKGLPGPKLGSYGYTSSIITLNEEEGWVETVNSVYKLGKKWLPGKDN